MARACSYYLRLAPYCCFCGRSTEEEIVIRRHSSDLPRDTVTVCAHRWCRRWRIASALLISGATLVGTPILLALAEAAAWYNAVDRWSTLPLFVKVLNIVVGAWLGLSVGIVLGRLYYRKVDDYVQLNALPYP